MGHHLRCPRQHGCLSFPPPPSVMAAGRRRPGQWPGQHAHAGVPLRGLPTAAALDGTITLPRTPGSFGGTRRRDILVARDCAPRGR
ncbi:hypothetical protein GQ55_4G208100 [Panicum hallii var. hallii]|uniref:Uncharacterized protein n=1 Tax=Panicum hallii var. hallii TaxID=1504633 RepID=A0A2T7DZ78_9POAL|nr:hypothetical protein GQ55_4G208100 [Panicum hallii var. hallii]